MKLIFHRFLKMLCICLSIIIAGCGSESTAPAESTSKEEEVKYKDGTYCADVTYYNPNTRNRREYTVNVQVENKELVKIYWPNGGWLDNSHFTPEEVGDDGTCSFTSDKGYQYTVEITGPKCSSTSSDVVFEGNDKPKEFKLTLGECASTIKMTKEELSEYETTFNVSRNDIISEKRCNSMVEYLQKLREIVREKKALETLMDNGYIKKMFSIGGDGHVQCQTMIVQRKKYYYLLEVEGSRKATMGLMDFDPALPGWQDVKILRDPGNPVWQFYTMRIIDMSSEMYTLAAKMETNCSF